MDEGEEPPQSKGNFFKTITDSVEELNLANDRVDTEPANEEAEAEDDEE